jgi:hypothetical protein
VKFWAKVGDVIGVVAIVIACLPLIPVAFFLWGMDVIVNNATRGEYRHD